MEREKEAEAARDVVNVQRTRGKQPPGPHRETVFPIAFSVSNFSYFLSVEKKVSDNFHFSETLMH